jgi:hypothetical protein
MTAKEYLSELQIFNTRVKQKEEQKQMLIDMAKSITAKIGLVKVQSSSSVDRMGDTVAKAADLEAEIDKEINVYWYKQHLVINKIQMLTDALQMQVLFKRYVQFKDLQTIASEIDRTYQYVLEVHKKALISFEKIHASMLCEEKAG